MTNNEIYAKVDAKAWLERNPNRSLIADHVLNIFNKKDLKSMDVAEFGSGAGHNCYILGNYVNSVTGYDISSDAINMFKGGYESLPNREKFKSFRLNICSDVSTHIHSESKVYGYDLIIFGFFTCFADEHELTKAIENARKLLKPDGVLIVFDFISEVNTCRPDKRHPEFNVYKRNLQTWMKHMQGFTLMDFKLLDNEQSNGKYLYEDTSKVDLSVEVGGDSYEYWMQASVYKKKEHS